MTVTSESEPASASCSTCADLLLQLRPEIVELALGLLARVGLGGPEVCEAVDELVGGRLHVLGGRLHRSLVERERVGGEGADRVLDARDPRAQLTADVARPLLARVLLVAAAAGHSGHGRESEDDGEQTEVTGGHLGFSARRGPGRKRSGRRSGPDKNRTCLGGAGAPTRLSPPSATRREDGRRRRASVGAHETWSASTAQRTRACARSPPRSAPRQPRSPRR